MKLKEKGKNIQKKKQGKIENINIENKHIVRNVLLSILGVIVLTIVCFVIYETATVNNTYYIGEKNVNIPIFIYHNIVQDKSKVKYDYMQTPINVFEKQITGLLKVGYKAIDYKDLAKYKEGKKSISKHSFLVTFDDGYDGVYKYAYPVAKKYNIPMNVFVIGDCIGKDGYLTREQIKEMNDSGHMNVYSHGLHHIEYDKVDKNQLLSETNEAFTNLNTLTEREDGLKVFAYPYGLYTNEDAELLGKQGYIENLADNKINTSDKLDLTKLHRCYALNDSVPKILLKIWYRSIKYSC